MKKKISIRKLKQIIFESLMDDKSYDRGAATVEDLKQLRRMLGTLCKGTARFVRSDEHEDDAIGYVEVDADNYKMIDRAEDVIEHCDFGVRAEEDEIVDGRKVKQIWILHN